MKDHPGQRARSAAPIDSPSKEHKKKVGEFFTQDAEYWSEVYERPPTQTTRLGHTIVRRQQAVLRLVSERAGKSNLRILELGCGTGATLAAVGKFGHTMVGIDISTGMLSKTKERIRNQENRNVFCCQADIEVLPFQTNSFDMLMCIGVLQYLESFNTCVSEISRVLKDRGMAIVTLPNLFRLNNWLDPYYYTVLFPKYLYHKALKGRKASNVDTREEFSSNVNFKNKRFVYGQLNDLFKSHNLLIHSTVGIGYTALTFWGKEFLSHSIAIRISDFFEAASQKGPFNWLKFFADRWVLCLQKK